MERVIDTSNKRCGRMRHSCPAGYEEYNEDWFLSSEGDMYNAWSLYEIDSDTLTDDDWLLHCMGKRWFDANTFLPAYFEACRRKGLKVVQMRISY